MEDDRPGRLTVDEFLRLSKGVLDLFAKTRLTPEDQTKLDELNAKLRANDPAVDEALNPKT